jgi:hypothetical protein
VTEGAHQQQQHQPHLHTFFSSNPKSSMIKHVLSLVLDKLILYLPLPNWNISPTPAGSSSLSSFNPLCKSTCNGLISSFNPLEFWMGKSYVLILLNLNRTLSLFILRLTLVACMFKHESLVWDEVVDELQQKLRCCCRCNALLARRSGTRCSEYTRNSHCEMVVFCSVYSNLSKLISILQLPFQLRLLVDSFP